MTGAQATHAVENQPPEFAPRDLWRDDAALSEALVREGCRVTICARMQGAAGEKQLLPVPVVILLAAAQRTAAA